MTEIDNDKLLKDFFAENKREIADNGFSRRVMHHLPDRSNRLARLWTVFVMTVGATLFVTLGGLEAVWGTLKDVLIGMINMAQPVSIRNQSSLQRSSCCSWPDGK